MRPLPRISLTTHGLIELVAGLALTVAALALDLGGAGTLATFAAGVSLTGIGLSAETLAIMAHQAIDRTLVVLLSAAAFGCGLAGGALAAVILLAAAAALMALEAATRWTRPLAR